LVSVPTEREDESMSDCRRALISFEVASASSAVPIMRQETSSG
jgi:hypothetical protein